MSLLLRQMDLKVVKEPDAFSVHSQRDLTTAKLSNFDISLCAFFKMTQSVMPLVTKLADSYWLERRSDI